MSNKKHTPIKAKPPVDTNKPKFTKTTVETKHSFYSPDMAATVEVTCKGQLVEVELGFSVKDIPTLIAVLQDIYSGANV